MKRHTWLLVIALLFSAPAGAGAVSPHEAAALWRSARAPVPALTPKRPVEGARLARGSTVVFKWKRSRGADAHELVIARDEALQDVLFRRETTGKKLSVGPLLAEQPAGTYFWAVRARSGGQFGAFGPVASFRLTVELTRDEAIAIVRDQVLPPLAGTRFGAAMLQQPLEAGDRVRPQFPHQDRGSVEDALVIVDAPAWFAFIDPLPGTKFAHDVKFVFVDVGTGELVERDEEWWPVVNEVPTYATDLERSQTSDRFEPPLEAARHESIAQPSVEMEVTTPSRHTSAAFTPRDARPENVPCEPSTVRKVAVVVQGGGEDAMDEDCDDMEEVLRRAKFEVTRFSAGTDLLTTVRNFIRLEGATLEPCDKFVLYISSHGIRRGVFYNPQDGEPMQNGPDWDYTATIPSSIPATLSSVTAGHITVIIDACHSAGIFPEMEAVFAARTGVEVNVIASADATVKSLMQEDTGPFWAWDFSVFTDALVDELSAVTFDENGDGFVDVDEFCQPLRDSAVFAAARADAFAVVRGLTKPNARIGALEQGEAVTLDFPLLDPDGTGQQVFAAGTVITLDRIQGGRRGNPEAGCSVLHLHDDPNDGLGIRIIDVPGGSRLLGPFPDPAPTSCGYGPIVGVRRFVFR